MDDPYEIYERAINLDEEANLAIGQGDNERAQGLFERALVLWRKLIVQPGAPEIFEAARFSEARTLVSLGLVAEEVGDLKRERVLLEQASELLRRLGKLGPEAFATARLASVVERQGELVEARGLYERALTLARQSRVQGSEAEKTLAEDAIAEATSGLFRVIVNLGSDAFHQGNRLEAETLWGQGIQLLMQAGHSRDAVQAAIPFSNIYKILGEYGKAQSWAERALALSRQIGDQGLEADCTLALGLLAEVQGKYDEARKLYDQAFLYCRQIGDEAREKKTKEIIAIEKKRLSATLIKDPERAAEALLLLEEAIGFASECRMSEADEWAKELATIRAQSKEEQLAAFFQELDGLIGLENVKQRVREIVSYTQFQKMRVESGIPVSSITEHMVFTGNPGTGKTTVARLLANMYGALNVLSVGHTVEADRSTLVGAYLGQTAQITKEVVKSATGGVLFIDEAYSLTPEGQPDSYGQEAVNTLLKMMEDHRSNLIVIIAGYTDKIKTFIASNPGLKSRFTTYLHFDDYQPEDMVSIFESFCKRDHYQLESGAAEKLLSRFDELYQTRDETFGNARLVRNIFEKSITNLARRASALSNLTKEDLTHIRAEDIPESAILRNW
jgi:tetratricopeptide (TPR) repeat protein